jgi:alpha-tubulin suppressor-like RCC1 family protein
VNIVKLEAGCRHSLLLDSKGKVYGYGMTFTKNRNTERIINPIELEDLEDLTDEQG